MTSLGVKEVTDFEKLYGILFVYVLAIISAKNISKNKFISTTFWGEHISGYFRNPVLPAGHPTQKKKIDENRLGDTLRVYLSYMHSIK